MNQQQLGAAEEMRKQIERDSSRFWSSWLGKAFVWVIIAFAVATYFSEPKKTGSSAAKSSSATAKPASATK